MIKDTPLDVLIEDAVDGLGHLLGLCVEEEASLSRMTELMKGEDLDD
jgi:hypothetical protein